MSMNAPKLYLLPGIAFSIFTVSSRSSVSVDLLFGRKFACNEVVA